MRWLLVILFISSLCPALSEETPDQFMERLVQNIIAEPPQELGDMSFLESIRNDLHPEFYSLLVKLKTEEQRRQEWIAPGFFCAAETPVRSFKIKSLGKGALVRFPETYWFEVEFQYLGQARPTIVRASTGYYITRDDRKWKLLGIVLPNQRTLRHVLREEFEFDVEDYEVQR